MDKEKLYAKKIATYGMLIALAMICSYIEMLLPISMGVPGIKLGLANMVTIVCLYTMGYKAAYAVSFLRIVLVGVTFGSAFSMIYAMAGGMLSLTCMCIAKQSGVFSKAGVSMIGGVTHNIGQLLVAAYIVKTPAVLTYLPVLMIAGIITGIVIGIISSIIIKRIQPYIQVKDLQEEL